MDITLLIVLVPLIIFVAGLAALFLARKKRRLLWPALAALLGAPALFFVAVILWESSLSPEEAASFTLPQAGTAASRAAQVNAPQAAPGVAEEARQLAVIAGRRPADPEIAHKVAQLDRLCPDTTPSTADLVVNLRQVVADHTGREPDIVAVLDQFIKAQDGPAAARKVPCVKTGGVVARLLVEGL
ncbi:hypothetical protein [Deinococcus multiflagellatus]|uniref:Uncharacterized protein n=1 Tax=Deinococcus multiflagellatus TaxID=1656887 RepID=A0ABW1ZQ63_9DEIO|nr:hypothetical protein [Deinococcus multiflagellatus]MBZ9715542.1 hypothetical protein [Deinococcus multiflagellatus]